MPALFSNQRIEPKARVQREGELWRWRSLVVLFGALGFLVICSLCVAAAEEDPTALEYKVKAGFLFNFLKFVDWPDPLTGTNKPYQIGVLESDPAGPLLSRALKNKSVKGRLLEVHVFKDAKQARDCHLLFLSRALGASAFETAASLRTLPVLTIGEMDGFAQRGGIINFVRKDESIRFEINLAAAEASRLQISSKLAVVATVVKPPP